MGQTDRQQPSIRGGALTIIWAQKKKMTNLKCIFCTKLSIYNEHRVKMKYVVVMLQQLAQLL